MRALHLIEDGKRAVIIHDVKASETIAYLRIAVEWIGIDCGGKRIATEKK